MANGELKIFRRGIQGICFFIVKPSGINGGTLNGPCCVGDLLPAHADTLRFQQPEVVHPFRRQEYARRNRFPGDRPLP